MAWANFGEEMSTLSITGEDDNYILVAAIDFGTTFSGYAFSFKSTPGDIKMNKSWGENLGFQSYKTPTCVLVDPNGDFVAFGYDAEQKYSELIETDQTTVKHQMYRHFKMTLHKEGTGGVVYSVRYQDGSKTGRKLWWVSRTSEITSTAGVARKAMDIFVMSLKYLKDHLISALALQTTTSLKETMIRWVITVPAIWTDEAKQFMREAAFKAGLITRYESKKLLIALEPEAASIYCRSLDHFSGGFGEITPSFQTGTKYLVIDAGGGTIDITAHEILEHGKLKELHTANGGNWGGTKVDENFIYLIRSILGKKFIERYQKECPQQWLSLMMAFEKTKKSCKPNGESRIIIPLGWTMGSKYMEITGENIEKVIRECGKPGIKFVNGSIMIENEAVVTLYHQVTSQIVNHLKRLLKLKHLQECKYFLLVGGFGECTFLQKAVQDKFKDDNIFLLVPSEAQMSVIKGAVSFGHKPSSIQSRIARRTYGTECIEPFLPGIHDKKHLLRRGPFGFWCENMFELFVQKGETVEEGKSVSKPFSYLIQQSSPVIMQFPLYAIDRRCSLSQPEYVTGDGFVKVGEVNIPLPNTIDRPVILEFKFGGTEIHVQAIDLEAGVKVQTTIDFFSIK